jgi:hypothetical protein
VSAAKSISAFEKGVGGDENMLHLDQTSASSYQRADSFVEGNVEM